MFNTFKNIGPIFQKDFIMIHPLSPFTQFSFPPHFGNTYQPLKDNLPTTNINHPFIPFLFQLIGDPQFNRCRKHWNLFNDSKFNILPTPKNLSIIDTNGKFHLMTYLFPWNLYSLHWQRQLQLQTICIDSFPTPTVALSQLMAHQLMCNSSTYVVSDSPLHFSPQRQEKALLYLLNSKKITNSVLGLMAIMLQKCCLPHTN